MSESFSARHRPFSLPASLDQLDGPKATGVVTLPLHIDWSSRRAYDLANRDDRLRVYELVLREGTLDDLRHYLDPNELPVVLDELFLPDYIKTAWQQLLAERVA